MFINKDDNIQKSEGGQIRKSGKITTISILERP